jgi:hypothetical protein
MSTANKTAADYILRVKAGAGSDPSTFQTINVNDENNPILIDSEHFTGYIIVRMLNFNGITPDNTPPIQNPASSYFVGRHRRYSIVFQGRFKKAWSGDEIIFGIDSDTPLRTPPGISMALKIAQWLDPALDADLSSNTPWVYSPFVSAMNALAVFPLDAPEVNDDKSVPLMPSMQSLVENGGNGGSGAASAAGSNMGSTTSVAKETGGGTISSLFRFSKSKCICVGWGLDQQMAAMALRSNVFQAMTYFVVH